MILAATSAVATAWPAGESLTAKVGLRRSREEVPISRLPANARNVTYYLRAPEADYEFDTNEAGYTE
jgi:hypothetical protein